MEIGSRQWRYEGILGIIFLSSAAVKMAVNRQYRCAVEVRADSASMHDATLDNACHRAAWKTPNCQEGFAGVDSDVFVDLFNEKC